LELFVKSFRYPGVARFAVTDVLDQNWSPLSRDITFAVYEIWFSDVYYLHCIDSSETATSDAYQYAAVVVLSAGLHTPTVVVSQAAPRLSERGSARLTLREGIHFLYIMM
jgi:hypothetical protein